MDIKNSLDLYRALTDANAQVAVRRARNGQNARNGEKIPMPANVHQLRLRFLEACHTGEMYDFGCASADFGRTYNMEALADALAPMLNLVGNEDEKWSLLEALGLTEYFERDDPVVESETSEDKDTEILDTVPEPEILDDNVVKFPSAAKNG